MLFLLIAAHAVSDFALQGSAMATCKCRRSTNPLAKEVPWYYWLSAHALISGLAVGLVIRYCGYDMNVAIAFAVAETVVHWLADAAKCEGLTGIHFDQLFHVGCKVAWWAALVYGPHPSTWLAVG